MKFFCIATIIFFTICIAAPVWSQKPFELIYPLQHNAALKLKIAVVDEGKRFVTYSDQQPILYDLAYGISIKKLVKHSGSVSKVISSKSAFYTLGDADIFCFDKNGNQRQHYSFGQGRGMRDFDLGANYIAGGSFEEVYVWDKHTAKLIATARLGYDSWTEQLGFINEGKQLITLGTYYKGSSILNSGGDWENHYPDSTLYLWSSQTGLPLAKIPAGKGNISYFRIDKNANRVMFLAGGVLYNCVLPKTFGQPAAKKETAPVLQPKEWIKIDGHFISEFEVDFTNNHLVVNAFDKDTEKEVIHFMDVKGNEQAPPYELEDYVTPVIGIYAKYVTLDFGRRSVFVDLATGSQTEMPVNKIAAVGSDAFLCFGGATPEELRFDPSIQLRSFVTGDVVKDLKLQRNTLTTAYTNRFGQLGLLGSRQCDLVDIASNTKLKYQSLEYGSLGNSRFVSFDSLLIGSGAQGGMIHVTNTITGETVSIDHINNYYGTAITGVTKKHLVGIHKDTVKLFDPGSFKIIKMFPQEQMNHFKGKRSKRIDDPFNLVKKIPAVAVVADDERLLAYSETDSTVVIKDAGNNFLHRVHLPVGETEFSHMTFLRDSHTLVYFNTGGAVFSIDANTGRFLKISQLTYILDDVIATTELHDGRSMMIITDVNAIHVIDKYKGDSLWTLDWNLEWVNVELSDDQRYLFGWNEQHVVSIFDVNTRRLMATIPTGLGSLIDGIVDVANNRFIAISSDFTIHIYDLATRIREITMIDQPGDNLVTVTKDNYYSSTKGSVKQLYFKNGDKLIAPEQLDIKYNRPDIVLQKLKNPNTELINSLRKAYEKRLQKLGIHSASLLAGEHVPDATTTVQLIPQLVKQNPYSLHLSFNDTKYSLRGMNIWINGVPLYGTKGLNIAKNRKRFDTTVLINLSVGDNVIEYSATNVVGGESFRSPLSVRYQPVINPSSKLYFIGIGVDQYADATHDLSWSVKDIRDLAGKLQERFTDIRVDTLFNERAVNGNILGLRKRLTTLSEEDRVIIAFSGHGLLNKKGDYYLGTYDVNFESPEQNGLPYESIEGLLDGIAPRKKLLLLDACHSGELDKDEISKIEASREKLDSLGTNIKSTIRISSAKKLGMTSSFEMMQNLFMNVSRGTGAAIISAAGGMQYAQERGDLKNGVFTYSIIDAFNKNNTLTITQLKQLVSENVIRLTDGLQKPTSRSETRYDWTVW